MRNSQLAEVHAALRRHVRRDQLGLLLWELTRTEAYRGNRGFRDTVDRLRTVDDADRLLRREAS